MKRWRNRKRRKNRNRHDNYTIIDAITDVILWIPELLIYPFRLIIWIVRASGKFIRSLFELA